MDTDEEDPVELEPLAHVLDLAGEPLAPLRMARVEPRLPPRVVRAGQVPVGTVAVEATPRRALQVERVV